MRDAPSQLPKELNAFGIRGGGMLKLMATHPPLEERIARLQGR
jgi:heat shock protein HtpX